MPQTIYEVLWIFIVYAVIGWCSEVAYAALDTGKFVNRGFLNGPYCPIYGFGKFFNVGRRCETAALFKFIPCSRAKPF